MSTKYKNPPLVEAVCELRLTPETQWDLTIPGLLYEKLKSEFPIKEQKMIQEVKINEGPNGLQQQIITSDRLLFFTKDRKMLIQVSSRLLIINVLKPYPHWEDFKSRIELAWQSLQEVVNVQGLDHIELRYINNIELNEQNVKIDEYFEFYPFIGKKLPKQTISFIVDAELPFANGRDIGRITLTRNIYSKVENKMVFILDLGYFLAKKSEVPMSGVLNWIEEAHSYVEEIFEGCITDKLRALFKEVS